MLLYKLHIQLGKFYLLSEETIKILRHASIKIECVFFLICTHLLWKNNYRVAAIFPEHF
jgi:hypothetical protein